MGTQDISRNAFDVEKQYSSVRQQQGRVLTDDDWNEHQRIRENLAQRALVDVIGSAASPDEGFLISNPLRNGSGIDFTVQAGRFYLGGHLLELSNDQTFQLQRDWLQNPLADPQAPRFSHDLVILEHSEQTVTAVEDSELYEVALGGADTTTRKRYRQKVRLVQNIGSDECARAWQNFLQNPPETGGFSDDNSFASDARLRVDFTDAGNSGDLCKPNVVGGYLGAENQTLRVQLREDQRFTWGFDNASPLYRVVLNAARTVATLITPPKDQFHWPQAGQTVELLAWASVLPNNEKVAEHQGFLTKVIDSYDPVSGEITLADALPTEGYDNWQSRNDADVLGEGGVYFYLRVWDRGSDQASDAAIDFTSGTSLTLGFTGIEITFSGSDFRPGDYWLISARPSAPHDVVPWSLEVTPGRASVGLKKYYAPLALLHWHTDGSVSVTDCRRKFKPLNQTHCCIELVARPGAGWYHVFDQIAEGQDAVICFPPGNYPLQNTVNVSGKGRLILTGNGKASRINGVILDSLLVFSDCDRVDIRDLYFFGGNQHLPGIRATIEMQNVNSVHLDKVFIRNRAGRTRDLACLRIDNPVSSSIEQQGRISITHCEFYIGHLQTGILIVNSDHVLLDGNTLLPSGPNVEPIRKSLRGHYMIAHELANLAVLPRPEDDDTVVARQEFNVPLVNGSQMSFITDESLLDFWRDIPIPRGSADNTFGRNDVGAIQQLLANRIRPILEAPTRFNNIDNWLSAIDGGARAFIGQGIVVAGRRSRYINISRNKINHAAQGIHLGLSHSSSDRSESAADKMQTVIVKENDITVTVGAGMRSERHGCFVGNADNATVTDNVFSLNKLPGMRHVTVDAIRIFGFLGPMVRVYGNFALGFSTCVSIYERGRERSQDLRIERENFLQN